MLDDYTIALITAIQNGTAYVVPKNVDKYGVIGSGTVHFPGEENYQIQSGKTMVNASIGKSFYRPTLTGARNIEGITYDPNSKIEIGSLFDEGLVANVAINLDKNNKIVPASNINDLVRITTTNTGGPTGFSKLAEAVFPVVANLALPGLGTALSSINAVAQGANIGDVLKNAAINQGISQGLSALGSIPADAVDLNAATADLQNVYGGALPIEDIADAFDTVSPLVDTTVSLDTTAPNIPTQVDTAFVQDMSQGIEQPSPIAATDTAFLQDMDQGIQPEVNLEGGDLGMTEAEAQNQYYESIGIDPNTVTDTPAVSTTGDTPEITYSETSQEDVSKSLTPQQIYNLLKIGAGLFGGAGAISTLAKNITGGAASNTPTSAVLPTVKTPTPFTGTYSGMNPYDTAYFQQVQQNYNRLFPTAPTDVATPLQSWYQTQYKPDTTISNKLFGV